MKNDATKPVTKGGITAEQVRKAVYKMFLAHRHQGIDLGAFLSGAMVVMNEVFEDAVGSDRATLAIPKSWYLAPHATIIKLMEEEMREGMAAR